MESEVLKIDNCLQSTKREVTFPPLTIPRDLCAISVRSSTSTGRPRRSPAKKESADTKANGKTGDVEAERKSLQDRYLLFVKCGAELRKSSVNALVYN